LSRRLNTGRAGLERLPAWFGYYNLYVFRITCAAFNIILHY